eukprot:CAMPEP_0202878282 /NCGR_PEP_ID=MMETSP1391-20130828/31948_1 /ASSEMBLY_ACC=CAM_ASM_000867 /TAXON_ID=1034604 /ORGANISM="Chlamydomonas leiostraca, Strain SAG 11-49" /LENGTH=77 /DNA_ID=CAMNT_0049560447 /DNA_START=74 /DNA_END=304 /DNA_ORIENTATION=-
MVPAPHGAASSHQQPVGLLLHLSDIHLTRWGKNEPGLGTRAEDLEVFAEALLSRWRPDGIILTGDLTDGKTQAGRGE